MVTIPSERELTGLGRKELLILIERLRKERSQLKARLALLLEDDVSTSKCLDDFNDRVALFEHLVEELGLE